MFTFFIGFLVFLYLVNRISLVEMQNTNLQNRLDSLSKIKDFDKKEEVYSPAHSMSDVMSASTATSPATSSSNSISELMVHEDSLFVPAIEESVRTQEISSVPTSKVQTDRDTEFAVGSKLITAIGMVSVFLGVIAFLRYAFENNLITPSMRVFLGVVFGFVFIAVGHAIRRSYDVYATGLIGGGLGIFYISAYAAFSFYELITEPAAFVLFLLITFLGVLMSLFYNSKPLIQFSLIAGFIVPLIFPLAHSVHAIFPYLIILNLSILIIARFKVWPDLTAIGLIATALLCIQWTVSSGGGDAIVETFAYLIIIFGIYFTTSFINFIVRDRDYKGVDAFLLYALPVLFFVWCAPMIETQEGFALFTFALAVFYIVASIVLRVIFVSYSSIKICSNVMIMIGSVFLAAATSLHFDGSTATIFWAIEAALMIAIGYMLNARGNRIVGLILVMIVGFKTLMFDFSLNADSVLIFNNRFFTVLFVSLVFAMTWATYKLFADKRVDDEERKAGSIVGAVGVSLLPFIWVNLEIMSFATGDTVRFLPIAWSLYALMFAGLSFVFRENIFRFFAHIILVGSAAILIVTQWALPSDQFVLLFNIRFLSSLVVVGVLVSISAMIHNNKDQLFVDEKDLLSFYYLGLNAVLLWALSLEVTSYYNAQIISSQGTAGSGYNYINSSANSGISESLENTKRVALSILWLGYASLALTFGIIEKMKFVRQFAIGLLAITVFKIFLYDTANLSDIYRFVSFITLGVVFLVIGFAYYRFKDRILELVTGDGE